MPQERKPGRTRSGFRPKVHSKNPAHHVLVDIDTECECDLLGDSATTPPEIAPFHFNDRINEFLGRSFRPRSSSALGSKQRAVLSFCQHLVKMQQRRWLQGDSGPKNACGTHEKRAPTSDNPIGNT